ncbi:UDP-N-acetylmuramoyl-tripeptide--D-alanyl-D-alanine ligase [Silvibacterium dinghuense]|uniref:UDP-N-acetylmuramoyl-tripeptide--D-alanyl-D-alanine ligase n=1 Tax=Silvibacterium dinghuense TaxID=1560006 RepID=A0A4Q1SBE9_9BACT|nr:UDP-N-acetylmuramoyl-tripeptide--D-alanyl-D-alanine ligase [Silvibacterium dinghuense]RXS94313.1 UDP-N-acetylmuramoyl-tripeptide--D-alanyl-D-alanine ligase [Silvibacterium dinghuense]GGH17001.1 UDP-N-acetylmuramoyl-tripeptide--D-alanyl-D-alanine ligase [Silvibacterium dinghuense]
MNLELHQAAQWCSAELHGHTPHASVITGYSIDSRTIQPGDLFFAVKGDRFDGHAFVAAAFAAGAIGAVVASKQLGHLGSVSGPLLAVEDPLVALQQLAAAVRRHWGKRVVGVTGSAGKTTTKEAIAAVLGARFAVLKSQGNLNNGFGLPLQLLKLQPEHEVAVIEMGMSAAGEIAALARIAAPEWGVVTNVGNAHAEFFPDGIAGVARAKYELIQSLPHQGIAFLNCDDHYVSQFGRDFKGAVVYFGYGPCADPRATAVEPLGIDGLRVSVLAGQETASLHLHLPGEHNVSNALAAIAVGIAAGIPLEACCRALEALLPDEKRGRAVSVRGATIINDSYNSNPEALKAMIATLATVPVGEGGRRILVAGEMLELGAQAAALHTACGARAVQEKIDIVLGVRGAAAHIVEEVAKRGREAHFFATPEEAGAWLHEHLQPGDVVLLKASRGVRLERLLDVL